jgi:hypothetical protein
MTNDPAPDTALRYSPSADASVVRSHRVVSLQTPVELGGACQGRHRVECRRDRGRLTAIHVFCRCGEQIVLQCEE